MADSSSALQNNFVRVEETMMREVESEGPISRARIMLEELVAQVDRLGEEFIAAVPSRASSSAPQLCCSLTR